ncbi:hypothetical protein C8R46DRAFT_1186806 [Mycena filopes]|nr:hypothetical protein C8R46DRAFT_1186806 [Mycena filopes]
MFAQGSQIEGKGLNMSQEGMYGVVNNLKQRCVVLRSRALYPAIMTGIYSPPLCLSRRRAPGVQAERNDEVEKGLMVACGFQGRQRVDDTSIEMSWMPTVYRGAQVGLDSERRRGFKLRVLWLKVKGTSRAVAWEGLRAIFWRQQRRRRETAAYARLATGSVRTRDAIAVGGGQAAAREVEGRGKGMASKDEISGFGRGQEELEKRPCRHRRRHRREDEGGDRVQCMRSKEDGPAVRVGSRKAVRTARTQTSVRAKWCGGRGGGQRLTECGSQASVERSAEWWRRCGKHAVIGRRRVAERGLPTGYRPKNMGQRGDTELGYWVAGLIQIDDITGKIEVELPIASGQGHPWKSLQPCWESSTTLQFCHYTLQSKSQLTSGPVGLQRGRDDVVVGRFPVNKGENTYTELGVRKHGGRGNTEKGGKHEN